MPGESYLKELENYLKAAVEKFREGLGAIRGNRPSVDLVADIRVNYYDQELPIKQLGSLSILPPRSIQVSVWDKNAVGPAMKAIEGAKIGLSTSNDGNDIIATLSPLVSERREELTKLIKKNAESARIQVRHYRDETIKKLKDAESKKEATEDEVFKTKEKVQKAVDEANKQIEGLVEGKLRELEG